MRVTIIADASFCPNTNVAGYGYWIATERGKQGGGGEMKGRVEGNIAAEMQAVANALHIALRLTLVQQKDEVLIQTDCMAAIDAFEGKRRNLPAQEWEAVCVLRRLRSDNDLQLVFRHVKGHTGKKEARFVTNKLCDRRAKEAMRRARARVQLENV
ncbi:MAG: RNase H family protein [Halothiobacillaceae bacterium]